MDLKANPVMLTDAYNLSHQAMKVNTDWEVSHIYNRNRGMILFGFWDQVIDLLTTPITDEMIEDAATHAFEMNMPFPMGLWEEFMDKCNGIIPLHVEAVPEGTYVPRGTPFAQIRNTVEGMGELVSWWEAMFIHAYFPSGCATMAHDMWQYLTDNEYPMTKIHSFGFRGYPSLESAYWGGMGWALYLRGSDDFHLQQYLPPQYPITSIPALAHKVVQQFDDEVQAYRYAIDAVSRAPEWRMLSMVIDTYNPWHFILNLMEDLVYYALSKHVHLVLRPDSGDTLEQGMRILRWKYQHHIEQLSVIIGEDMDLDRVKEFDQSVKNEGLNPADMVYGVGAGFYKTIDRNFLGWSMKTSYSNGAPRMKFSAKGKTSIPGRVTLGYLPDPLHTMCVFDTDEYPFVGLYKDVYYGDPNAAVTQVFNHPHFEATLFRARDVNTSQKEIELSPAILDNIQTIRHHFPQATFKQT